MRAFAAYALHHACINVDVCAFVYLCACVYFNLYACVCMCMHVCACVCTHTHTRKCTAGYKFTTLHAYTHKQEGGRRVTPCVAFTSARLAMAVATRSAFPNCVAYITEYGSMTASTAAFFSPSLMSMAISRALFPLCIEILKCALVCVRPRAERAQAGERQGASKLYACV